MHAMIALLAPLAVQVAVPGFAPPLGRPLSYTVSEVRQQGTTLQRFVIERRVTFSAAADGFVATVDTLSVTGDAGQAGKMFEAMTRSMIGRRVILHLDRAGKVVTVDDLDAVWDAQLTAMTTMPAPAAVTSLLAPLRSLSPAAKTARVGDMIAPLIAGDPITPTPSRTITLPARGPDGTQAMLAGTERVDAAADGMLLFERRASGVVSDAPMSI